MRGRFITFEGGEGTGKSTQAALLAKRLRRLLIGVVQTREPGGSLGAEIIRYVLLSGAAKPLGADAEAILFAAARADHISETIKPALAQGRWVICDRFVDSTRVYQGIVGNVDPRIIRALERITVGDLVPDLTLVLDIDPKIGLQRAAARRKSGVVDRFEEEDLAFHQRLREAYAEVAGDNPDRCILIDASGTTEEISETIWKVVSRRLDYTNAVSMYEDAS